MSAPYEEILNGESCLRPAPGERHELICDRLHGVMRISVANISSTRLLAPRTKVLLSAQAVVCPDLALVTTATGKLWLAAEVIDSDDHLADTVVKKQIYEDARMPRLWMIDPRYDNLEVYHRSEYGFILKGILAGRAVLTETLLPDFQLTINELFK